VRQALYGLSHTSSTFSSGYLRDRVSLFAQASLDLILLHLSLPTISGISDGHHHTQLFLFAEIGVNRTFCLG
jgi:hypothetical protein